MASNELLATLFGDEVGVTRRIVLWTREDKKSYWFDDVGSASSTANTLARNCDVYFGVSLQNQARALRVSNEVRKRKRESSAATPENTRGMAATSECIGGLWCDIDIAGPGHSKSGLPKSREEADKLIAQIPLSPTISLWTGGGYHLWWAFREPWVFELPTEREAAARLSVGWQGTIQGIFNAAGCNIDNTSDLARVMRLPGTKNHKHGDPVPCEIVESMSSQVRYNPSDIEEYVVGDYSSVTIEDPVQVIDEEANLSFVVNAQAQPHQKKFEAALELMPDFSAVWKREKKFPSQSEYDMSLASMVASVGWSDQEIIDLIVAHRRQLGGDPKHGGYYRATLRRARTLREEGPAGGHPLLEADETTEAQRALEEYCEADMGEAAPEVPAGKSKDRLSHANTLLGLRGDFEIESIYKYLSDPPIYELRLRNERKITLGSVDDILSARKFRSAVAAVTGVVMPMRKDNKWQSIAQALLQCVEEKDLGSAASLATMVDEWVQDYVYRLEPSVERNEAFSADAPWLDEETGEIWAQAKSLRRFIELHHGERGLTMPRITRALRSAGYESGVFYFGSSQTGKRTSTSAWKFSPKLGVPKRAGRKSKAKKGKK